MRFPVEDVVYRASRSSGPGGQHANVTESRITAVLDLRTCSGLTDAERARAIATLGGEVRAVAQDARSQVRNKELALARLEARLASALRVQRVRRDTKPTRSSVQKRIASKQQRGAVKRTRQRPSADD